MTTSTESPSILGKERLSSRPAPATVDRTESSPVSPLEKSPGSHSSHGIRISATVCALLAFFLINALLSHNQTVQFDRYRYIYRGRPWWILNDLRVHGKPHNAALLGSSLMVSAVAGCDAKYLNKDLDQTEYHNAAYVDHLLDTKFGGNFSTFDLAIPGQMPSDAYMALRAALNLGQHPDLVIYGIAPRDFIDSTLLSPIDTETYHYLSRLVDIEQLAPELFKEPQTKFNRILERSVFLYGHSLDFQISFRDLLKQFVDALVPAVKTAHPFTYWDRCKLLPNYLKGELYPTAMIASPKEQTFSMSRFTDNTTDYIERYKKPRPEIFQMQLFFLKQLASLCKENHAELVLVNMPITHKNISILGDTRYNQYLDSVRGFGAANGVPVLDLNDFDKYSIEDFHDLVHLNGTGATKFFDSLVDALSRDTRTSQVCKQIAVSSQGQPEPPSSSGKRR